MVQFLPKFMINGAILILIQSISHFRMAMSPGVPLMGYTYINLLFNDLPSKAKQIDFVNSFIIFWLGGENAHQCTIIQVKGCVRHFTQDY